MSRQAARFALALALLLALIAVAVATHGRLSAHESRASTPTPVAASSEALSEVAPAESAAPRATSDRDRLLAWVSRHKGVVSFDPIKHFLQTGWDKPTWHAGLSSLPAGDVVAVKFQRGWDARRQDPVDDLQEVLADVPDGATIPVLVFDLPNAVYTPQRAAHLRRVRRLRCLVAHQWVTDDDMAVITEMRELERLVLRGPTVTDASLALLGRLPTLRHLDLFDVAITGESGDSRLLPETLDFLSVDSRPDLRDAFVASLPPLPNLRELRLDGQRLTDAALPKIGAFAALQALSLRGNQFSDKGMASLGNLRHLEVLDLARAPITDGGLAAIVNLPGLGFLGLEETRVTSLAGIGALQQLHYLQLEDSDITDDGLASLLPLTELRGLYLGRTAITDRGLVQVSALAQLRSLDLRGTRVTDAGLVFFRGLGNLEKLDLRETGVGDDGVRVLTAMKSLRELDLSSTNVTVDGLLALKDLPCLRHVDISAISADDAARLKAAMPDCTFD